MGSTQGCCFKQILKAALHKTVVVWPLTSHLTSYQSKTSKTWWALLGESESVKSDVFSCRHTSVGLQAKIYSQHIHQVSRVFANGPEDLGSIPVCIIPKTSKMVLDTSLLNTRQNKVRIKDKVEQSMERSSALRYTSV